VEAEDVELLSDEELRALHDDSCSYLAYYQKVDEGIEPNPPNYHYMRDHHHQRWRASLKEWQKRSQARLRRQMLEEANIKHFSKTFLGQSREAT